MDTLNPQQQEVVEKTEGPLLVLAGAGAGKTKTITHRIIHIIEGGTAPNRILAVTFTNKAANEMRERVLALIKEAVHLRADSIPFVATFHSLGVHVLRENAGALGLTRHFTIFDRSDSLTAVKNAMKALDIDPKQFNPRSVLGTISKQKGDAVTLEAYVARAGNQYYPRMVSEIWHGYTKELKEAKALDFDDLLLETLRLLQTDEAIRTRYQSMWDYIHVDEYQDTNKVQYEIMRILSATHRNLCCVGDIDQNIYAWRGATIENILEFEQVYPEAALLKLEQNYRSTKTIVAVSNAIIERNKNRRDKTLFTENKDGEKLSLFVARDELDEAHFVANRARRCIEEGLSPEHIAVLYRANFQSRVLEEAMLHAGVPYQVLGTRFFDRKEIKDILSFIRASLNGSLADISRIINVPPRGIGKVTLAKLASGKTAELSRPVQAKIQTFYSLLEDIKDYANTHTPSQTVKFVLKQSGMEESFKEDRSEEGAERLENCKELVTLATKYDGFSRQAGIEKLLEEAALGSDQDELDRKKLGKAVKLMTVHAAKGLEFSHVFITGLEEGLFPHEKMDEKADEEEERRLFYVALTRAKEKLFLSYAGVRTIYGSKQVNLPSTFILDIDDIFLEAEIAAPESGRVIYIE